MDRRGNLHHHMSLANEATPEAISDLTYRSRRLRSIHTTKFKHSQITSFLIATATTSKSLCESHLFRVILNIHQTEHYDNAKLCRLVAKSLISETFTLLNSDEWSFLSEIQTNNPLFALSPVSTCVKDKINNARAEASTTKRQAGEYYH